MPGGVAGGQPHDPAGLGGFGDLLHRQRTIAVYFADGPAVPVAHVIGTRDRQAAIVFSGEYSIADVRAGSIAQAAGAAWAAPGAGNAVGLGALIEFGDRRSGGRQHDAVDALIDVGTPRGVGHVRGGRIGADVHALIVEIEAQGGRIGLAQRQTSGRFGRVGEPNNGRQGGCPGDVSDVAQDTAGTDGGELLIVADEHDRGAAAACMGDEGIEVQGGGHARFVDQDQGVVVDPVEPCGHRQRGVRGAVHVLGERVCVGADLCAENLSGCCGGRQPEYGSAAVDPCVRQHGHGGGLAGARWCEREPHASSGAAEGTNEGGLVGVECEVVVRGMLEQRHIDAVGIEAAGASFGCCGDDSPFGGDDVGGGVHVGAVRGVDRFAVAAAQEIGLVKFPVECGGGDADAAAERRVRELVGDVRLVGNAFGAGDAPGFGVHVRPLPFGSGFGHGGEQLSGFVVEPLGADWLLCAVLLAAKGIGQHLGEGLLRAQHFDRFVVPGLALFGE
ncbi:Uncharacterised protein [Mycobacteroides abscessus subsp. abscessus]|nr:Uncharacterised protein [Mycobacteroides abscessus subsp. abscessus]SKK59368.1 Uncharacterised protein [Mycobacteroides abscessus subsp. abscessus]